MQLTSIVLEAISTGSKMEAPKFQTSSGKHTHL